MAAPSRSALTLEPEDERGEIQPSSRGFLWWKKWNKPPTLQGLTAPSDSWTCILCSLSGGCGSHRLLSSKVVQTSLTIKPWRITNTLFERCSVDMRELLRCSRLRTTPVDKCCIRRGDAPQPRWLQSVSQVPVSLLSTLLAPAGTLPLPGSGRERRDLDVQGAGEVSSRRRGALLLDPAGHSRCWHSVGTGRWLPLP